MHLLQCCYYIVVGNWRFCLQLLQYCYITMLWIFGLNLVLLVQGRRKITIWLQLLQYCYMTLLCIYGLTVVLLVEGRGEMAVLPSVTAVLLHYSVIDIWIDCSVVSTV
jgi:hypothetical protein